MIFSRTDWCRFTWTVDKPECTIVCGCIRKTNHEGNHVSHPSGEETPQTSSSNDKKLIDKTNEYQNLQLTS